MGVSPHSQSIRRHTPMSPGHAGDPGPGEMTMLSKAFSLYTRLNTSLHVHSSLRTTTGGTPLTTESSWKML
uniref:Uncharacterized protein n=1 Tax=Arundo donax TaxID=35708 RepID=A0A0A9D854_ARUDO